MKRVTSLGGIFFKSDNPEKIRQWYKDHLGFNTDSHGTNFEWRHSDEQTKKGYTVWSPFDRDTKYFEPSSKDFMINYRVENLGWLIKTLKEEGVKIEREIETFEYGKFAHILDPEGTMIELWEPYDEEYEKLLNDVTK